jgi:hypothetical protein
MAKKKASGFMAGFPSWDAVDLGSPIHTAMRKCCDSTLSSMAHSLVSGLGDEWILFLRAIKKGIDEKLIVTRSRHEMWESMRFWLTEAPLGKGPTDVLTRDEWQERERKDERFRSRYYALMLAFRLMAESGDLDGALVYLFDEDD